MPPIITLLTDFGTADSYVGEVKGTLLSRVHGAALFDITHQVPPGDLRAGQYILARAWHRFPQGTVHLVVVDPGVGTTRRALAAGAAGHFFVAPDNGLLSCLPSDAHFVSLPIPPGAAPTFHARDVFAPAASGPRCEPEGVGIFTFAITRSAKPNSGTKRGSCASSRYSLRSRSATARHSPHCARCNSRAAGRRP